MAHTCLLTESGRVACWRANDFGQFGVGSDRTPPEFGEPVEVSGLDAGVTRIAVGWYHTCALGGDGMVRYWGRNESGQLGGGTTIGTASPSVVSGIPGEITSLAAGAAHTCALSSGSTYCWGQNSLSQLGDGSTTNRPAPALVRGIDGNAASLTAGSAFTWAILTSGALRCWGEVGFAHSASYSEAFPIPGLEQDVAAIAAGVYHLCAIRGTGKVLCLGSIFSPAVGAPSAFDTSALTGRARQLVSGADFSCALTAEGDVECWGDNYFGQLGDPSIPTGGPVRVGRADTNVIALGAGEYTVCALTADGGVTCWGDTSFGQIGDETARWR